jgi:hypothetical protein
LKAESPTVGTGPTIVYGRFREVENVSLELATRPPLVGAHCLLGWNAASGPRTKNELGDLRDTNVAIDHPASPG